MTARRVCHTPPARSTAAGRSPPTVHAPSPGAGGERALNLRAISGHISDAIRGVATYIASDGEAANLLFQLISARHQRAGVMVTSNNPFRPLGDVFGHAVAAAAMETRRLRMCRPPPASISRSARPGCLPAPSTGQAGAGGGKARRQRSGR
ncbi:MAG: ATP-binding protein [Candidatus Dormibacteraeota bacterium]|uniref:ATP-binding protein n=1 Tax=Candidatus Amunia macphersoniae TaxID=3127014 RepID=A0A934NFC5_9BACT|nr:ATP-binding protein [Candidatus Dormibacteraeota bacterium]